jgi:hypothetical protein
MRFSGRLCVTVASRTAGFDLLVEFANSRYQNLLDRYIAGSDVPYEALQRVWNFTTAGKGVWGRDGVYEELIHTVRAVNLTRPPSHRIRVLAGDLPVDWERDDLGGFVRRASGEGVEWPTADEHYDRELFAIEIARRESLAKGRRIFAIYGGFHMMRGQDGIVQKLEQRFHIRNFVIAAPIGHDMEAAQPNIQSWPVPSLTMVRGTVLAPLDLNLFLNAMRPEKSAGAYYDAVVYLGPASTLLNGA